MSEGASNSLSVSVRDHTACVRVKGSANFRLAPDFKALLAQLGQDGCTDITLDLSECTLMDSTFQGAMLRVANQCESARKESRVGSLTLFHPSERVLEALANLDILRCFRVVEDPPKAGAFQRVEDGQKSVQEINLTCFEAHQELMNSSDENARRFRDATEFFGKNLRKDESKE